MPRNDSIEQLYAELRGECGGKISPPLHQWQPRESLDINLRIAAGGQWFYQGSAIQRRRLVKLFCSLLRLEADGYYLITPRLKYPVAVDDAPFAAVEVRRQGSGRAQNLVFRTNADDLVLASRAHPLRVETDPATGRVSPSVEVRDGLRAKLSRAVYYELAEMLEAEDNGNGSDGAEKILGLYSGGEFFPF